MTVDAADSTQPSPIGIGHFGTAQADAVKVARDFLERQGVVDDVLLVFNAGRAKGKGIAVPRLNFSPNVVIASRGWWVFDRAGHQALASGGLEEIRWTKTTSDGFKMLLTDGREVRLFTGRLVTVQVSHGVAR